MDINLNAKNSKITIKLNISKHEGDYTAEDGEYICFMYKVESLDFVIQIYEKELYDFLKPLRKGIFSFWDGDNEFRSYMFLYDDEKLYNEKAFVYDINLEYKELHDILSFLKEFCEEDYFKKLMDDLFKELYSKQQHYNSASDCLCEIREFFNDGNRTLIENERLLIEAKQL